MKYVLHAHPLLSFRWLLVVLVLFEFHDYGLKRGHVDMLNVELLDVQVLAEETNELLCIVTLL